MFCIKKKRKKRQAKFGYAGVTKSKPANTRNHAGKTSLLSIGLIQGNGRAGLLRLVNVDATFVLV